MGISVGGKDLEHSVINGEKGDIEGSTSKIEDEDVGLSASLVHTVSNSSGSGLVDDTLDPHSRNGSGILGRLTLGIVEVSGDSDDGILDFLTKEGLGGGLHLLEDHGGNFLGCVIGSNSGNGDANHGLVLVGHDVIWYELLVRLDRLVREVTSDKTLDIKDGVLGVDGGLILGGITDETLSVVHEGDVGRGDTVTLVVGHDFNTSVFENTDTGVGGSEIDTDDGSH
mmetsp:Transcript_11284/g.24805  ORF Transcript_11284/g.24805 Transcript_11284/m.24805 type:complete len:226 (-) Transcript_11284:146-823(-)